MKPQLEEITLGLPEQAVLPGARFKLNIEARGDGLPGDGSWLQVILRGKLLNNLAFSQRPRCTFTDSSKSELWQIELEAPVKKGVFGIQVALWDVESEQEHIKTTLQVVEKSTTDDTIAEIIPAQNVIKPNQPSSLPKPSTVTNKKWLLPTLAGLISIILIAVFMVSMDTDSESLPTEIQVAGSAAFADVGAAAKTSELESLAAFEKLATEAQLQKIKVTVTQLLQRSMHDPDAQVRSQAWQQLSQLINKEADNTAIQEARHKRKQFQQETEQWLQDKKNIPEVVKRIQVLAKNDDANGQYQLAQLYEQGNGVEKHLGIARQWYQKAIDNGAEAAKQALVLLDARADTLLNSKKLKQRQFGYQLAELSALEGKLNAQLWMAYRYEQGDGVPKDIELASQWYNKAAIQGNELAKEKLAALR